MNQNYSNITRRGARYFSNISQSDTRRPHVAISAEAG